MRLVACVHIAFKARVLLPSLALGPAVVGVRRVRRFGARGRVGTDARGRFASLQALTICCGGVQRLVERARALIREGLTGVSVALDDHASFLS